MAGTKNISSASGACVVGSECAGGGIKSSFSVVTFHNPLLIGIIVAFTDIFSDARVIDGPWTNAPASFFPFLPPVGLFCSSFFGQ